MSSMKVFTVVSGQILGLLEIVIVVDFLTKCFEWKGGTKGVRLKKAGICGALLLAAQCNGRFGSSHTVVIFADIILLFLFCELYLEGSRRLHLLGCLIPFLVISVISTFIMQLFALLRSEAVGLYMIQLDRYLYVGAVLAKVILFGALYGIRKFWKSIRYLSRRYYFLINVLIVFCVVIEILLFYVVDSKVYDPAANRMLIMISVGIMLTSVYIWYSTVRISEQNSRLMKYELMQLKNEEKERQIGAYQEMNLRMARFQHDYRNHCINMQNMLENGQYEETSKYLQDIAGRYMNESHNSIHTGNAVIDAVINNKIFQCRNQKIQITCFIVGDLSGVKGSEIGIILFNLLDNAIEANEKIKENRRMELRLSIERNTLNIIIRNRIPGSVLAVNSRLMTDKKDKGMHGIGHIAVRELAEEMGGLIEYYEEEDMFCAHVFLPV